MVIRKKLLVKNKLGLHARPASLFVQAANKFDSTVNVEKDGEVVSGKSIMGILTLAVEYGNEIYIEVEGDDAEEAINSLEQVVSDEG